MATKKKMLQAAAGVGGDVGAWDLSYAYYDDPLGWDLSTAFYTTSFSVAAYETSPRGIFLKPDGTKMYVVGSTGDDVNEFTLSTPYLVSTATYVQRFSVSAQDINPSGIFFKPDGSKMYITGPSSDKISEYDLSTAWDISTASYLQNFSITNQPNGVFFRDDGLKMYTVDASADRVYEYDLSTAWDVTTASVLQSLSIGAQDGAPEGISFKSDGTKMFIVGNTGNDVTEYDLSTSWDISSATVSTTYSVATQETNPRDIFIDASGGYMYVAGVTAPASVYQYRLGGFSVRPQEDHPGGISFKPDGTKMYIAGLGDDNVNEYNLGQIPPFSVAAQDSQPHGVVFKPDGTKMYVIGNTNDTVYEYNLSTAWNVSTASYVQGFSVASKDNTMLDVFLKPDGTKMYVLGDTSDSVYEYDLSTAWDISTASYVQSFSVGSQNVYNRSVFFKPDGTKMYVLGQEAPAEVNEYDLSTAWDISSASFLQLYNISALGTSPEGLFFKPDGTKMYIAENVGNDINEFDLSTAWDVTTSSFNQLFSVAGQETSPSGVAFDPDGTKMYVVGFVGDDVNQYDLSTAWDISTTAVAVNPETYFDTSTAVFSQLFSVGSQETLVSDLFFKPDGTKMYVIGYSGDDVNEYDLSSAWDVSSAVFNQLFSVSAQDAAPFGLSFKPDGTKMYVAGFAGQDIIEYDLSTAWDVSSSSFNQAFSVAAQTTGPLSVSFKDDGTKMYVTGSVSVIEYDLSTAWDVSTAVFLQLFSVSSQEGTPSALFFKPDGTKMFVAGYTSDKVYTYSLGVPE